jgi:hypothetical protein
LWIKHKTLKENEEKKDNEKSSADRILINQTDLGGIHKETISYDKTARAANE